MKLTKEFTMGMITPSEGWEANKGTPLFCSNCGRETSAGARFCPGCGRPAQRPANRGSLRGRWILYAAAALVALLLIGSLFSSRDPAPESVAAAEPLAPVSKPTPIVTTPECKPRSEVILEAEDTADVTKSMFCGWLSTERECRYATYSQDFQGIVASNLRKALAENAVNCQALRTSQTVLRKPAAHARVPDSPLTSPIETSDTSDPVVASSAAPSITQSPVLISKVDAGYTNEARAAGIAGTVELTLTIDESGVPTNVRVSKHLEAGLDQNAIAAVSRWRFQPAVREGQSVPSRATVQVAFKLL